MSEDRTELMVRYAALSVAVGESYRNIWHVALSDNGESDRVQQAMFKELRELAQELWPK